MAVTPMDQIESTGLDEYSGSTRYVRAEEDHAHVALSVEATSGSNEGRALLTPDQARAFAGRLVKLANSVSGHA